MRVTQRMMITSSLAGLNGNLAAVNRMQEQLTSGKVLTRPSDSPTDTNTAMQTRSRQAAVTQQADNITENASNQAEAIDNAAANSMNTATNATTNAM